MAAASARREAVLWLSCQPGEIKLSAVPTTPWVSFQPLSCYLPTLGLADSADSVNSKTTGTVGRIPSR